MTEQLGYLITNSSFLMLSLAERLLLLSAVGLVLLWVFRRLFKPRTTSGLWAVYLIWLVLGSAPLLPALPQAWLAQLGLSQWALDNPCAMLPIDRIGSRLVPFAPYLSTSMALFGLWSLVTLALLLRLVLRRRRFLRIIRRAEAVTDPQWQKELAALCEAYRIRRVVYLCRSAEHNSPFTIGVGRPAVFVPTAMLRQLDAPTLRVVIAHELAHVSRRDDLSLLLMHIFRAIFFFNPAAYYADRALGQAREIGCDALAVRQCRIAPKDYGRAMLRVLELFRQPRVQPVVGFLNCDLNQRVQSLMARDRRRWPNWAAALSLGGALLVVSLFFGGVQVSSKVPLMSAEQAAQWLAPLSPVHPMPEGTLGDGLNVTQDLGCPLPHRDGFHSGVDLVPSRPATPVRAFADGSVIVVKTPAGNIGQLLRLEHANGVTSTYARLDTVTVTSGQAVRAGQVVATVGATARTDHLHFEVARDTMIIDPGQWLNNGHSSLPHSH